MSHASPLLTQHLRIHGLVQGVYYRASMVEQARRRGVTGWVRNRLDGSVEALLQGPPEAVQALTLWARQGPAAARVDAVHVQPAPEGTGAISGFEQVATV